MVKLIKDYNVMGGYMANCLRQHETDQLLAFERGNCIFAFNFHPTNSQTGMFINAPQHGDYKVILSTDDKAFGGFDRIDKEIVYHTWAHDPQLGDGFAIYLPARTAVVLQKVELIKEETAAEAVTEEAPAKKTRKPAAKKTRKPAAKKAPAKKAAEKKPAAKKAPAKKTKKTEEA